MFLENVQFENFQTKLVRFENLDITPKALTLNGAAELFGNYTKNLTFKENDVTDQPVKKLDLSHQIGGPNNWDDTFATAVYAMDNTLTGSESGVVMPNHPFNYDPDTCFKTYEFDPIVFENNQSNDHEGNINTVVCQHDIAHLRLDYAADNKLMRLTAQRSRMDSTGVNVIEASTQLTSLVGTDADKLPIILNSNKAFEYQIKGLGYYRKHNKKDDKTFPDCKTNPFCSDYYELNLEGKNYLRLVYTSRVRGNILPENDYSPESVAGEYLESPVGPVISFKSLDKFKNDIEGNVEDEKDGILTKCKVEVFTDWDKNNPTKKVFMPIFQSADLVSLKSTNDHGYFIDKATNTLYFRPKPSTKGLKSGKRSEVEFGRGEYQITCENTAL